MHAHADTRERYAQRRERIVEARAVHARAAVGEDALVLDAELSVDVVDRVALLLVGGATLHERRGGEPEERTHQRSFGRPIRSASFRACCTSTVCNVADTLSASLFAAALPARTAAV